MAFRDIFEDVEIRYVWMVKPPIEPDRRLSSNLCPLSLDQIVDGWPAPENEGGVAPLPGRNRQILQEPNAE